MSLKDRILNDNITAPEQLAPADRELAQADPGLTALIQENAALGSITEGIPAAPPWENLRSEVIRDYTEHKENAMTMILRIMGGQKWYVKLAFSLALVAGVLALSLLLPRNGSINPVALAWAASDGYTLTYDLPAPAGGCKDDPLLTLIHDTIKAWTDSYKANAPADAPEAKVMLRMEVSKCDEADPGTLQLTVMALNLSYENLESLRAELAAKAGVPEPAIEESTWFMDEKMTNPDFVSVMLNNRTFNFPPGATEEEMETLLTEWIKTSVDVEFTGSVDVEIGELNGEKQIKIKIMKDKPAEE